MLIFYRGQNDEPALSVIPPAIVCIDHLEIEALVNPVQRRYKTDRLHGSRAD